MRLADIFRRKQQELKKEKVEELIFLLVCVKQNYEREYRQAGVTCRWVRR